MCGALWVLLSHAAREAHMAFDPTTDLQQSFTGTFRRFCKGEFTPSCNTHYWFNCRKAHVLGGTIPMEVSWSNKDKPSITNSRTCEPDQLDNEVMACWRSFEWQIREAYQQGRVHFRPDPGE